jgi:DNA replication protein DnaC
LAVFLILIDRQTHDVGMTWRRFGPGGGLPLIIDDLGVGQQKDFALENLFPIIDERYKSNKPLIITTNLTLVQMEHPAQMVHKLIYDRILEKCIPLAFDGGNKRSEKRMVNFAAARQQFGVAKRR